LASPTAARISRRKPARRGEHCADSERWNVCRNLWAAGISDSSRFIRGVMRTLCASRTCRSRRCTPEVTGPTDAFWPRRATGARDQPGVPQWLTTARGRCGDHIQVHLIHLGICVRHANMPTTMPRPSEPEAAAPECGSRCPVIPAEEFDSESPAEVATSLADAAWTSAEP
jgi:hypothetical protein